MRRSRREAARKQRLVGPRGRHIWKALCWILLTAACCTAFVAIAISTWHLQTIDTGRVAVFKLPGKLKHDGDAVGDTSTTSQPTLLTFSDEPIIIPTLPHKSVSVLPAADNTQMTTLIATAVLDASMNGFSQHSNSFLSDYANGDATAMPLAQALERCRKLGDPPCGGVTCERGGKPCSVRAGSDPRASPAGEVSYIKKRPVTTLCLAVQTLDNVQFSAWPDAARNAHVFYYMWYGSMSHDGKWAHWNHELIQHWDKKVRASYPTGRHDPNLEDIGSTFWPSLGAYSSRSPEVVRAHMQEMRQALIGVAVLSWYPSGRKEKHDDHDHEELLTLLLDEAARAGIEVAIHVEPYEGRTPETLRRDIRFILDRHRNHPGLHRRLPHGRHRNWLKRSQVDVALPVFYVYDSYHTKASDWARLLASDGPITIRGTELDAIVFCLWVDSQHRQYLEDGAFDGAYTYFAADGFSFGSSTKNWPLMASIAEKLGTLFVPSVGPGYNDLRVRPWNGATVRQRNAGQYFDQMFGAALQSAPAIISITSWNEWHEGTNIEPAMPKTIANNFIYEDYGSHGPRMYLDRVRKHIAIWNRSERERRGPLASKKQWPWIPVLIVCHARANYLQRALRSVLTHRPDATMFPLIASQDGNDLEVFDLLQRHVKTGEVVEHLRFLPSKTYKTGYHRLAAHYHWAFSQVFDNCGHDHLIVLEEDLEVAPDFFSYFAATLPLLRGDPSLFCVSAWNDNGRSELASDTQGIFRTDFFPGLGWLLLRKFWIEVRDRWPDAFWDDFIRRKDVRKDRHCIRPEVSRTHTFGEIGVSKGQFYKTHLSKVKLNSASINWISRDLNFLADTASFETFLSKQVLAARVVVTTSELHQLTKDASSLRAIALRYSESDYKQHAKFFGLMEDEKDGIRRGAYRGVIPFTWSGVRIFLVRDWPFK